MKALDQRNIVITGGSLGIGFAVAKKCAEDGARVIIAARNESDLAAAKIKLDAVSSAGHAAQRVDIADGASVEAFAAWCRSNLDDGVHGLVNCAGVYGPIGKTPDVDFAAFEQAIQINFLGTVRMCQIFAPLLTADAAGKKKIVNYSGGGAAGPFPNYSAYATSKVAVVRFTENLSQELAEDGVMVNCIAPGFVVTRLHEQTTAAGADAAGSGFFENTKKQVDKGGVPPEKAANLTAFLLSSAGNGVTGKFLSAPWDPWETDAFIKRLETEKNYCTLRRIDDKMFFEKKSG